MSIGLDLYLMTEKVIGESNSQRKQELDLLQLSPKLDIEFQLKDIVLTPKEDAYLDKVASLLVDMAIDDIIKQR